MGRYVENAWRMDARNASWNNNNNNMNVAIDIDPQKLSAMWSKVRTSLRAEIGEVAFKNWVQPLSLLQVQNTTVQMTAPNRAIRDWVLSRYGDKLRLFWVEQCPGLRAIEIQVASFGEPSQQTSDKKRPGFKPGVIEGGAQDAGQQAFSGQGPLDVLSIGAPFDPRFTFSHFVTGPSNELAFAAAKRVAESDGVPFNPLFLYGGVGLGKTHLMHAIAWEIQKRNPDRKVLYLSAEKFMYQFIRAIRQRDTVAFKDMLRSVDVLMIDDLQFISGKESTQEEFFHTFNALVDNQKQVIISADRAPAELDGLEERMRSRLAWGLSVDIQPSDPDLRLKILKSKSEQMKSRVPDSVLEFLSHKITSNVRELEGALNRLVAHATLVGREITLDNAQDLLRDLLRSSDRRISIDEIQKKVAEHYNIRLSDMHSPRRARVVARPRQIAMYLAKQLTQRSLPEIGRKFGGRDHTTVMHAVRKIEELCGQDSGFAEDVTLLKRMLEQ